MFDKSQAISSISPGVRRIQAEASTITSWHRWVFFFSIFICVGTLRLGCWSVSDLYDVQAYAYGLDGGLRSTFQVCDKFATLRCQR